MSFLQGCRLVSVRWPVVLGGFHVITQELGLGGGLKFQKLV
jgi:hypothetical protein